MTKTIIIILAVIAIILAAGLVKQFAGENKEKLLEILKSDAFRSKLLELGGYGVHNPGTVREHF